MQQEIIEGVDNLAYDLQKNPREFDKGLEELNNKILIEEWLEYKNKIIGFESNSGYNIYIKPINCYFSWKQALHSSYLFFYSSKMFLIFLF